MILCLYSECSLSQWSTTFILFLKCKHVICWTCCVLVQTPSSQATSNTQVFSRLSSLWLCHDDHINCSSNACSFVSHGLSLNYLYSFLAFFPLMCMVFICSFRMIAKHLIMRIVILTSVYPPFSHLEPRT